MAQIKKDNPKMEFPLPIARQFAGPLDANSVFYSLTDAEDFAKNSPLAYVGQVVTVVDETAATVDAYKISTTGSLEAVSDIFIFELSGNGGTVSDEILQGIESHRYAILYYATNKDYWYLSSTIQPQSGKVVYQFNHLNIYEDPIAFGYINIVADTKVWYITWKNEDSRYVKKTGDTMTGELTRKHGSQSYEVRGHYNGTPTIQYNDNFRSGFYDSSWAQYDKCIVCGEGNDKAIIQWDYGSGWHLRVSNNGIEQMNLNFVDAAGNLKFNVIPESGWLDGGVANARGYVRIVGPNVADKNRNLVICYGIDSDGVDITFPITFSVAPFVIVTASGDGTGTNIGQGRQKVETVSINGFTLNATGKIARWIAIGYRDI